MHIQEETDYLQKQTLCLLDIRRHMKKVHLELVETLVDIGSPLLIFVEERIPDQHPHKATKRQQDVHTMLGQIGKLIKKE